MREIRFHGRGGQGAVTAAEMLVVAFIAEGKYAAGFPMFGFERRGAPTVSFVRFDDQPIRQKTQVYFPDCLIVFDPPQVDWPATFAGLKPEGILVANRRRSFTESPSKNLRLVATIDATKIALEEIGIAATNTCLLGALAHATGWLNLNSILTSFGRYFEGKRLQTNIRSCERGFREVEITKC